MILFVDRTTDWKSLNFEYENIKFFFIVQYILLDQIVAFLKDHSVTMSSLFFRYFAIFLKLQPAKC